ncbi:unnamed protein product [Rotaria magnacalcarata]|uniref:RRM domain-containing protein n=1 Tax=Rotaria magnacalcarata TaxID=392030 RepID=A0A8S2M1S6_9BILA|nr:unnamed protein product [Rotaria magnacalcarata]
MFINHTQINWYVIDYSKFNLKKSTSNDILRRSEDELFIPHRNMSTTKVNLSRYRRCWIYSQNILSFILLGIFIIVCFGLTYANFQLKNEVQNLSSRLDEIETKFSNTQMKNSLTVIEQIKTRLNFLENWNISFVYNQLQKLNAQNDVFSTNQSKIENKSIHSNENINEFDHLETEIRLGSMMNESIARWNEQFNSIRDEIKSFNQNIQIEYLIQRLEKLAFLVHKSSDKVGFYFSNSLINKNSDLDKLQNKIDDCKCSQSKSALLNELMSIKRRQLFVGLLDNQTWSNEKLCDYFNKHASENDEQYIVDCDIMAYNEAMFQGKSFAFITFTDSACVDRCMAKRVQINNDHRITIKRLLPDTITKSERLMSSKDIVIRIVLSDPFFTHTNIQAYFTEYGKIIDIKMLEEEDSAGMCFITFEDFDSTDRVLLDTPHYLNGQLLSVHKYVAPEYISSLSQYRFIDERNGHQVKRWYPIFRNFTDFIQPLKILYKTQIALIKYNMHKKIDLGNQNLSKAKENLHEFENKHNDLNQNFIQFCNLNDELKQHIEELVEKTEKNKNEYEKQIEEQQRKNQALQDAITYLDESSAK